MDMHDINSESATLQGNGRMDSLHNSTAHEHDLQRRAQAARRLHAQSGGYSGTKWSMISRLNHLWGKSGK